MKGSKVAVLKGNGETWTGLVVSEPSHYSFWYVLVMDKDGGVHSVDTNDLTVLYTAEGSLPSYGV